MEEQAMKKVIFTLLLFGAGLSLGFARPHFSELSLSLIDGSVFDMEVNDRPFHGRQQTYTISGLEPGRHFIRVIRYEQMFNGRFVVFGRPSVVFAGFVTIPARTSLTAHIDFNGRFVVTQRMAIRNPRGRGWDKDHRFRDDFDPIARMAMHPREFQRLITVLSGIAFESRRLDVAMQALSTNLVTSFQVRELLSMFNHESNRLDLAKSAYNNTVDPENFFIVNEAFHFSSSIRELNRFIAHR